MCTSRPSGGAGSRSSGSAQAIEAVRARRARKREAQPAKERFGPELDAHPREALAREIDDLRVEAEAGEDPRPAPKSCRARGRFGA
jgi:hypothetical protein